MSKKKQVYVMHEFEKLQKLEVAAYGKVYKARHKSTGQMVIIKKYNLGIDNEGIPDCFTEESNLLKDLSNSFYVFRVLHGQHMIEEGKSRVFIVCEHLDKDLRNFIHSRPLHPSLVQSFMYQLCMGVAHCHSLDVLHRDLKPENLIADTKKGILKVADFHLKMSFIPLSEINSPQIKRPRKGLMKRSVASLCYRAPELLLGSTNYTTAINMWSIGCIFAEMVTGSILFHGQSEHEMLYVIFRLLGTPTLKQWPGLKYLRFERKDYKRSMPLPLALVFPNMDPNGLDLLSRLLEFDPAKRISADGASDHPYFDSLDKFQY